jgi:hypothetical protein
MIAQVGKLVNLCPFLLARNLRVGVQHSLHISPFLCYNQKSNNFPLSKAIVFNHLLNLNIEVNSFAK